MYPTGDGYLSIAALNRGLREKLCAVLEITDEHVGVDLGNTSDETYFAQKALMGTIEQRLLQHPNEHWVGRASKRPAFRARRSTTARTCTTTRRPKRSR